MQTNSIVMTPDTIKKVAQQLFQLKDQCAVYTFTGSLGAGKTTLIKELCELWGVREPITSPTFNYVNAYKLNNDQLLYHFDLYRLSSIDQFIQAGFDEFLYLPKSWAFIEWPEIILPLLKHHVCHVAIEYSLNQNERIVVYRTVL
ncbi:MAG: tRNA threonylcarbamoyladenosine biosynthesis protein TsaE [Candidatus Dependentiae bacterium ADurb.Bin331]|nr:MAG: tRNA threonylcarbamoyladenosine biosynthesis protein TsaE [Candidatus Dependentiae bacterium ADurb.Bin331]